MNDQSDVPSSYPAGSHRNVERAVASPETFSAMEMYVVSEPSSWPGDRNYAVYDLGLDYSMVSVSNYAV